MGFSVVLLLLVIVAYGNIVMLKMITSESDKNTKIKDAEALAENLKYLVMTTNDTGAYYLLSNTQQDADMYLKKETQAVTDVKSAINNLKELTGDPKGVALLDDVLNEYSKYVILNKNAFQAFQFSLKIGTDGKTLVKDEEGVSLARGLYFSATISPVMNKIDKYTDWLSEETSQSQQSVNNMKTKNDTITVILTIIALILGGLTAYLLSSNIVRSVIKLRSASAKIAEGDFSDEVILKSKDEFGELAQDFNKMTKDLRELIGEVIETATTLGSTSEELSAAAQEATSASDQVANTLGQLASGATEQAKSVENTGSVLEQLSANAQQVANNAENVSQSSEKAAKAAELGASQAENAIQKIEAIRKVSSELGASVFELGDQSKQIGQIIDVIKGIAEQTNLLALNAAIEAARAGENGRGFAVVAEEVRKLAEQSSMSATEIETLVNNIQRGTERSINLMEKGDGEVVAGVEAVNLAGTSFRTIVREVNEVVEQIKQVTIATQQMAEGTSQAVRSIENIGDLAEQSAASTQEVSAASEEQAATMVSVSQSAESLARLGERLSLLVAKFKV